MTVSSDRLDTALPGSSRTRGGTRAVSTRRYLKRALAAVGRGVTMRRGRHRRPGPADRGGFAPAVTAGLTRGMSLLLDERRRD